MMRFLFVVAILGYLAYRYGRYRKQKMKEVDDLFYDLLENTIGGLCSLYFSSVLFVTSFRASQFAGMSVFNGKCNFGYKNYNLYSL